jgi:hypothetical protein
MKPGPEEEAALQSPTDLDRADCLWQDILMLQLRELWNDNRQFDVIVWQIPAAIGAIAGILGSNVAPAVSHHEVSWMHAASAATALLVTCPLVLALYKNRYFQVSRNEWRAAVFETLRTKGGVEDLAVSYINYRSMDPHPVPGLVSFSTPSLNEIDAKPLGLRALDDPALRRQHPLVRPFIRHLSRLSAFKVLWRVSLLVVVAELLLTVWLIGESAGINW